MKKPTKRLTAVALAAAVATAASLSGGAGIVDAASGSFNCYTKTITTKSASSSYQIHTHVVNGSYQNFYWVGGLSIYWPNHSGTWNVTPSGTYVCVV